MNNELKKLKERFELEIWLYLDGSLSETEAEFWKRKIERHGELKKMYNETLSTIENYKQISEENLPDSEIELMIENIQYRKEISIGKIFDSFIEMFFSNRFVTAKLTLLSLLTAAALIILLNSEKPNAVKEIGEDILSWQGNSINEELYQMDNSIETLSMEEWEKYQYFKATHDEWEETFYILNSEIEKIKRDLQDTSL